MIKAPFLGVGLLKMSSKPHGCGAGDTVEEFYVAIFGGRVSPHKFRSYADALKHYEKLFNAAQKNRKKSAAVRLQAILDADVA